MNVKRKTQTSTKSLHQFMTNLKLLTNANEFTPEELLESAIVFEHDSEFLKQNYTHHVI